jgi:cellulose synthase/poly-beta-1,6-N-acetylglucosamine synthase-like glycosyltransferase
MFMFLYVIWGAYFLFLGVIIYGWWSNSKPTSNKEQQSIAVIVPFRNEENNLEKLVSSIKRLTYKKFEIIFINDHSEDHSRDLIISLVSQTDLKWHLIDLADKEGKKAAIETGINFSNADLIVTTDADCWMESNWLTHINDAFDENTNMVAGPVILQGEKSLFHIWQQLEFSTLIGTGGAMINLNSPMMCNGANLAYRKLAFEKVNGFEGINQTPSGDDELLMFKFKKLFSSGIKFLDLKEAVISTYPAKNWSEFKHQRKRWSSKWKINKRPETISVALLIMFFHLTFIFTIVQTLIGDVPLKILIALLGIKFLLEVVFAKSVEVKLGSRFGLGVFLLSQAFYSFYAVIFGVLANFGKYDWKGRTFKI